MARQRHFKQHLLLPSSINRKDTFLSSQFSGKLPENNFNDGWLGLYIALKASLIGGLLQNSNSGAQDSGDQISQHNKEGGRYIGAFYKSR